MTIDELIVRIRYPDAKAYTEDIIAKGTSSLKTDPDIV